MPRTRARRAPRQGALLIDAAGTAYRHEAVLRGGLAVCIRTPRPDDRSRVETAFRGIDPQSIRLRFFGAKKALTAADWESMVRSDLVERAQLFVTTIVTGAEVIIGSGVFVRCGADRAEVAFLVEEDYQGRGLAGLLLQHLAGIARRTGIARFEADVLPENSAMLAVFTRCGWTLERRLAEGVVHLTLELPAT